MSQQRPLPPPSSLNFQDILYVVFKHKWKIALLAAIAAAVAANVYFRTQPLYESEAKLMVRYVVDRSAVDPLDSQPKTPAAFGGDSLTNAEIEILTSWDLAEQAAEAIGVERLTPGGDKGAAAHSVRSGLTAVVPKANSNVILVSYRNGDPALAKRVLEELVSRYFVKHLEVHRSVDAFNFVTQQTDQLRERLNQTEEVLKRLKDTAGISSLAEATDSLARERLKIRDALEGAEAEHVEQKARIAEMEKSPATKTTNPSDVIPPEKQPSVTEIQQYQTLVERLDKLRDREVDLLASYIPEQPVVPANQTVFPGTTPRIRVRSINSESGMTYSGGDREKARQLARERYIRQNNTGFAYKMGKKDYDTLVKEAEQDIIVQKSTQSQEAKASKNVLVQLNRTQIENLEKQRLDLEKRYPKIAALALAASTPIAATTLQNQELGLLAERVRLAGIEARIQALRPRLRDVQERIDKLSKIAPQITQLERTKEIEENNYKYFQASLEKARIDEALDPSKMPNISAIQKPSPAVTTKSGARKKGLALAGGIFGFGVALIFLMELVVNRTVKRPLELETLLGIPFLLSIPYFGRRPNPPRLRSLNGQKLLASPPGIVPADAPPWKYEHFIRPFCEAIRDRLVLYFELHGMNHKPKLVAVTGFSHGAGSSTISAGLAAALSETGDGKVLLVDMNVGRPEVHPFFRGAPECSLAEALVGSPAPAGENLYLAVATPRDAWQDQLIPKKFYNLMPHLKASEFDYIIFDMPPLNQTSITPPMAGLMDKVLTVVEAEKSDRDFLKRTYAELLACRANVAVIFNKARSYIPRWLAVEG
jgi:uncharacterized protein involved in exopolysaccharide biosynthesis/Mrp family chromosome partitioning ATPase